MADRPHPYPMFPQNLPPNPLQHPQIPQQPPQSQQPDPQMISALSNPEHSRMWPQMNQLQNAYRPQQSGDLAAPQMNHQMHEFARAQALSHGQGQPMVQQMQQSFGLNAQRMNASAPPFHDPQANMSQFLMSSNSHNMPMNASQQAKTPFNMNPMMHAMGNNPNISRQLKMLNQPDMARLPQPGLGAQHAPNQPTSVDMFASSSVQPSQDQMHVSPHPAAQSIGPPGAQGMVPGNQQTKRMLEFQERRAFLQNSITQCENSIAALLQSPRNPASIDPLFQQKITHLRNELASRREVYTKFLSTYGAMVTQQMANGMGGIPPSNMPLINPISHSASQQPQQPTAPTPQVQPGFVTQANQPITAQYNIANGPSPMPTQSQGTLNQQLPVAAAQIGRPNTIPPRTGGTPHQIPGGQLPNNMSPNMGNFTPQSGQKMPSQQARQSVGGVMPLDKQRFESTYAQFCRSQNINATLPGLRVQIGENRTVDLHQLHVYVMQEGGASQVTARDMWAVIGGRLGFVQFPGNESEPARSGPGIAQQLHNTYEQYLQHFENAYILTVRNRGSSQQPMNPNPVPGNSTTPGVSGNPTEMPPNVPRPGINPQLLAAAMRYVHANAQDMRAQRVPDQLIAFVERHRPELLKLYQQQVAMMMAKRNAEQGQQNNANAPGQPPNVPEQASIGLQPPAQRPHPTIGANNMISMPPGDTKMVNGSFPSDNIAAAAALNLQPPTHEQLQLAMVAIGQLKQRFQQSNLPGMAMLQVPDDQRMEYNQIFEQVFKLTSELDGRLHLYYAVFKSEEFLRRFVAIVITVARQRQLLSNASPQYIIPLVTLRNMQMQILKLNEEFDNRWRAMRAMVAAANSQQQAQLVPTNNVRNKIPSSPHAVPSVQNMSQTPPHVPQNNGRQVSLNPSSQQALLQPPPPHAPPPPPHTQPNQPQPQPQQSSMSQPTKKPFPSISPSPSAPPVTASIASPTPPPAASSSTPATSAPTPQTAAGSPQTPKSPPPKAATKTKATRISRKLSTASKGPVTPETVPASVVGVKRPPEEDVSTFTSVAPSEAEASSAPSPKKAKMEWEGEMSEAILQRQQQLENVKTDEDTVAFLDHFKELFAMNATTDNGIPHELASTLNQILAGVAQEPADAAATAAALSVHGAGDAGPPPTALSPHLGPLHDAFSEFFDFSHFTTEDEDSDSKAPTPDLVPSSETNPSPESGSEGDSLGSTGSPDKTKIEELGGYSDPLRLGSFGEIDGGESAYYQTDNWKWEGAMHTLDQPWAISTS